jgi:hypothetical protein
MLIFPMSWLWNMVARSKDNVVPSPWSWNMVASSKDKVVPSPLPTPNNNEKPEVPRPMSPDLYQNDNEYINDKKLTWIFVIYETKNPKRIGLMYNFGYVDNITKTYLNNGFVILRRVQIDNAKVYLQSLNVIFSKQADEEPGWFNIYKVPFLTDFDNYFDGLWLDHVAAIGYTADRLLKLLKSKNLTKTDINNLVCEMDDVLRFTPIILKQT